MNEPRAICASPGALSRLEGNVVADRYRIEKLIARGGMGHVYRATDLVSGLPCAMKLVAGCDCEESHDELATRFTREVEMTARIKHPNCVSVIGYGTSSDGMHYLAMELLEGRTLAEMLRAEGALPLPHFLSLARSICEGVRAAHQLDVVHRDLTTSNIFLVPTESGELVKVLDFGIAKGVHDVGLALTQPGRMLGTPLYMAPEQILEQSVDTRADIYSLGVVFFEMLVARVPFHARTSIDVLIGHTREPVPLMSAIRPDLSVPAALEAMVRRMLAKNPDGRTQSLDVVLEELSQMETESRLGDLLEGAAPAYSSNAPPHAPINDPRMTAGGHRVDDRRTTRATRSIRAALKRRRSMEQRASAPPTEGGSRSRSRAALLAFSALIVLSLAAAFASYSSGCSGEGSVPSTQPPATSVPSTTGK